MNVRRRFGQLAVPTAAIALLLATLHPGLAHASVPCPAGTPSAERFWGLPSRLAYGREKLFSLEYGNYDWDVSGDIDVTMTSGAHVLFDDMTPDPLAEYSIRLKPSTPSATVAASFEQTGYTDDGDEINCQQTISRTVTGFTAPIRLVCNRWTRSGHNVPYRTLKPRRCSIWRANWAHSRSASFIKARWTAWGKSVARARATLVYNMGYRARVRVKAYRLRFDCTGRYRVYTRASITGPDGHGVVKPNTCA